ncbi:ribosomal RNA processing protein 1 homolog A-like isoform X2 [Dreissena polymorpha]|uniref:ribosomal RNA processing protein 1 homolog A-like isoform X2 n=1 Tax=Dreissena polymorpha TaxID=45954 RepID=UPI002264324F|nr:ribosomal RNA processing protein 1 homolog A-like isoform X2 [Dreissena polymorpha]
MASFLPVEVKFAQSLADNEKKNRFRAVKKLKKYLRARSSSNKDGFTTDDLLKIWKGLHYCMWMQDQPLIQEELSVTLSQMVHELASVEAKMLFIKVFFITEAREWSAIDVWRIDKFMMLMRCMLHESLIVVQKLHWKPEPLDRVVTIYTDVVMSPTSDAVPDGLKTHFTDIYLEEVEKVGGEQLTSIQLIKLLDPFATYLKLGKNPLVHRRIISRVFEPILTRAMELTRQKTSRGNEEPKESDLPYMSMQFDNCMIADHLFQQGQGQGVTNKNRTALYDLVKRLRDTNQGTLPRQKEVTIAPGVSFLDMKKAVTSLVIMETQNTKEKTKKKKKKKDNEKNENTDPNNNAGGDTDLIQPGIETAPAAASKKGKRKYIQEDYPDAPLTKIKKKNTEDETDTKSLGILRGVLKNKLKKGIAKNKSSLKRENIAETAPLPSVALVMETRPSVATMTPNKYKKVDKGLGKVSLESDKRGSNANIEPPQSFKITRRADNVQWIPKEQAQPIKFRDSELNKTPAGFNKKRKAPEPVETLRNDVNNSGFTESLNSPLTPFNPTKKPEQGILKSPNTADASTPVASLVFGKATPPTPRSQNAIARVKAKRRGSVQQVQTPSTVMIRQTPTPILAKTGMAIAGPTSMKKRDKAVDFFYM